VCDCEYERVSKESDCVCLRERGRERVCERENERVNERE